MAIKIFIGIIVVMLSTPSLLLATPPTSVKLMYDTEKQMLQVEAAHVSENLDRHYVRRIEVYKNETQVDAVSLTRQQEPSGVTEEIKVNAQEGDKISVIVYCKKGGKAMGEVTVAASKKAENSDTAQ